MTKKILSKNKKKIFLAALILLIGIGGCGTSFGLFAKNSYSYSYSTKQSKDKIHDLNNEITNLSVQLKNKANENNELVRKAKEIDLKLQESLVKNNSHEAKETKLVEELNKQKQLNAFLEKTKNDINLANLKNAQNIDELKSKIINLETIKNSLRITIQKTSKENNKLILKIKELENSLAYNIQNAKNTLASKDSVINKLQNENVVISKRLEAEKINNTSLKSLINTDIKLIDDYYLSVNNVFKYYLTLIDYALNQINILHIEDSDSVLEFKTESQSFRNFLNESIQEAKFLSNTEIKFHPNIKTRIQKLQEIYQKWFVSYTKILENTVQKIDVLNTVIINLKTKLKESEQKINKLQTAIDLKNQELAKNNENIQNLNEKITNLRGRIFDSDQKISELEKTINEKIIKAKNLEKEVLSLKQDVNFYKEKNFGISMDLASQKYLTKQVENNWRDAEKEIDKLKRTLNANRNENKDLLDELDRKDKLILDANKKQTVLFRENEELKHQLVDLRKELDVTNNLIITAGKQNTIQIIDAKIEQTKLFLNDIINFAKAWNTSSTYVGQQLALNTLINRKINNYVDLFLVDYQENMNQELYEKLKLDWTEAKTLDSDINYIYQYITHELTEHEGPNVGNLLNPKIMEINSLISRTDKFKDFELIAFDNIKSNNRPAPKLH
ncbi:hypothetical protein [[Mycoplasma] gypis]|uniref:Uncharacterized protein n=1 Tax=[Mycoplasma] gypis TaxID=92404 RepID=A0ABZ2RPK5_9BACT|nr:hypothetical protein [[Mycoplasma] gypis]MBN0919277.1 hypothetical protein [[Mycoplasma] gypis]